STTRATSSSPSSTATWWRSTRRAARPPGSATCTPTSNPRRWRSAATSTSATTRRTSFPSAPPTARSAGSSTRRARSKRAPATTTAASTSPTTNRRCSAWTPPTASSSGGPTRARCRRSARVASTPPRPVAFGHVYAARDDGIVYAFDEKTGKVEWFFPTHNFIYGSPAVARVPGTPPSVYIGSYDEHFYALDALSGKQRWRFDVGGPVPGTAVVIGHTVYTSSFKTREAIGIDVRSHRKTFFLRQAGYTPVVSDGRRLYAIGYFELIGLEPTRR